MRIHRSEITKGRWIDTSIIRTDGKVEKRELYSYGNRHALFDNLYSDIGDYHVDEHNPTNIPVGAINHLAKWGNEKTGINEGVLQLIGWGALLVGCYKAAKYLDKHL